MSNSTISINTGAQGAGVTYGINSGQWAYTGTSLPSFNIDSGTNTNGLDYMFNNSELTFSIIKANGGYVVRCGDNRNTVPSVYIIPDSKKNFDRELGKIITMHLLKD
jgi:hypothetical protein